MMCMNFSSSLQTGHLKHELPHTLPAEAPRSRMFIHWANDLLCDL